MNTANLQVEGILMAIYSLLDMMKRKGVLNQQEIEDALRVAKAKALEAEERHELSEANAEAVAFPIQFLQEANSASKQLEKILDDHAACSREKLVKMVKAGQPKPQSK